MKRHHRLLRAAAVLAALVLVLTTSGILMAATATTTHTRLPMTSLSKTDNGAVLTPNSTITYDTTFTLIAPATAITLTDSLTDQYGGNFHLIGGEAVPVGGTTTGPVTCTPAPCPATPEIKLLVRSPQRETWQFFLGDLPAGTYTVTFDAKVPAVVQPWHSVRNAVDVRTSTNYLGSVQVITKP
ncbi:MAG: hypothetical protein EPO21_22965 [Chloroflexota bacterium]|nr:MAG: hypothetical protein EPO21_22965 [Chloroflexota bacterium]